MLQFENEKQAIAWARKQKPILFQIRKAKRTGIMWGLSEAQSFIHGLKLEVIFFGGDEHKCKHCGALYDKIKNRIKELDEKPI